MANLYPVNVNFVSSLNNSEYEFKSTYAYDFESKTLTKNIDGTVKKLSVFDSYVQWCLKALLTSRYCYPIYDNYYGCDKIDINNIDYEALKLEIKRTVTECLKVHPLTKDVSNFDFEFRDEEIYYTFDLTSTLGSSATLNSTLILR